MEEVCILCLDNMINEAPLSCGHIFHIDCIRKHFKPECPVCRKEHNIDIVGTKPELFLPFNNIIADDIYTQLFDNINGLYFQQVYIEFPNNELVQEEDEGDEENPRYDNWDYEDV